MVERAAVNRHAYRFESYPSSQGDVSQSVEETGLEPVQCEFESRRHYQGIPYIPMYVQGAHMTQVDKANSNSQADSTTASAGSATGAQQTEVGSGYRSAGAEVTSDIGQAENYIGQLIRESQTSGDYDNAVRAIELQGVANAQALANRVNNLAIDHDTRVRALQEGEISRTVRHSDLAIDRQWNVDEVAQLVAKTAVFQDAIAGAVAAAVAAVVSAKE